ncbi:MAG: AzlD domain-containing protein [Boseongicola sp.]|nr:MAG: AzlD domain-containing protein [Boseongicola sp.]
MSYSTFEIWTIIVLLGIGTYFSRFSFFGLVGDRKMPDWVLRHLRYTPVAVLPGLVAPLAIWPVATDGDPDPARLAAAFAALALSYLTKNMLWGVIAGGATLIVLQNLL